MADKRLHNSMHAVVPMVQQIKINSSNIIIMKIVYYIDI